MDGREALAQGLIRRIGTGEDTKIWDQDWIPRSGMMRPIASLVQDKPTLVSELIDRSSASWREEKVREVFIPLDVESILRIPLCTRRVSDFWAWGEDDRGVFSVRSVYKFLLGTKLRNESLLLPVGGSH